MAVRAEASFDEAHLQSLASSLGKTQDGRYVRDIQCRETLQDLLRFFRQDTARERPVMMQLHAWNLVEKDLLPLIKTYHSETDRSILDAIKLLVFMTLPYEEEATNGVEQHRAMHHTLEALVRNKGVFAVIFSHLSGPLERYESSKLRLQEDDGKTIQLLLTLIRNVLLGAENHTERGDVSHENQLKENLLNILFDLHITAMLVQMAKDARKKPFTEDSALLIEVFHLFFNTQSPSHLMELLEKENGEDSSERFETVRRTFIDARKGKYTSTRHARFGSRATKALTVSSNSMKKTSFGNFPSEYFGKLSSLRKTKSTHSLNRDVQLQLAKLAMDLSSGGFNEIILASWNNLRHQQHNLAGSEEQALRTYSFLSLAHFFVAFIHVRLAAKNNTDPSITSAVSNVFDKHVFHWLRMIWDQCEEAKSMYGMVLVSGLMKEMLGFIETVIIKGSPADKFACEALVSEILWSEAKDTDFLHFYQTLVRRYDSKSAPLVYLANIVEGMHAASSLLKRVNPDATARGKEFFDERVVNNHISLLAFWNMNSRVLNDKLVTYLEEVNKNEMEHTFHEMNNLQIIYSIAVEDYGQVSGAMRRVKRIASQIIADFMKSIYVTEDGDYKKRKFIDMVF